MKWIFLIVIICVSFFACSVSKKKALRKNYILHTPPDTIWLLPPLFSRDDTIYIDTAYLKKSIQ